MIRESLKDLRIIRVEEVINLTGFSRSTIARLEKEDKFPASVQLADNSIGWFEKEVVAWIKSRPKTKR